MIFSPYCLAGRAQKDDTFEKLSAFFLALQAIFYQSFFCVESIEKAWNRSPETAFRQR
jgi:hypothetical protein